MELLLSAKSLPELKSAYKKLATAFHPDKGGNPSMMQQLNSVYQKCCQQLRPHSDNFEHIQTGETVYVNGTTCEVIHVTNTYFRVVAVGRSRQAVFTKATGIGKYNKRLKASYYAQKKS